jgi:preprotein translocase subunit SecG
MRAGGAAVHGSVTPAATKSTMKARTISNYLGVTALILVVVFFVNEA